MSSLFFNGQTVEACDDSVAQASVGHSGIWRSGDVDYAVTVTRYLGQGGDGRDYVSVRLVRSGVPLDELELLSQD